MLEELSISENTTVDRRTAIKILGISAVRFRNYVKNGRIIPVIRGHRGKDISIFKLKDVIQLKEYIETREGTPVDKENLYIKVFTSHYKRFLLFDGVIDNCQYMRGMGFCFPGRDFRINFFWAAKRNLEDEDLKYLMKCLKENRDFWNQNKDPARARKIARRIGRDLFESLDFQSRVCFPFQLKDFKWKNF